MEINRNLLPLLDDNTKYATESTPPNLILNALNNHSTTTRSTAIPIHTINHHKNDNFNDDGGTFNIDAVVTSTLDDLRIRFAFQPHNAKNMHSSYMSLYTSRLNRCHRNVHAVVTSIHEDYIGLKSNFYKWFLCIQSELGSDLEHSEFGKQTWKKHFQHLSLEEMVEQVLLYLLIWGEAAQLRFCPELLCFLFKTAIDALKFDKKTSSSTPPQPQTPSFLNDIVRPLYLVLCLQVYSVDKDGSLRKRHRDHHQIIGYDDVNEFFWEFKNLASIPLATRNSSEPLKSDKLMDLAPSDRFRYLRYVQWKKVFKKTFYERRTILHLLTNFSNIFVIHIASFYFFTAASVSYLFFQEWSRQLAFINLGGFVAMLVVLLALLLEPFFVPFFRLNFKFWLLQIVAAFGLIIINAAPTVVILLFPKITHLARVISIVHLALSLTTTFLAVFWRSLVFPPRSSQFRAFTSNFAPLKKKEEYVTIGLWVLTFLSKFIASHYYLISPFGYTLFLLLSYSPPCASSSSMIAKLLCSVLPKLTLALLVLLNMVLYFLDTYIWFIIWSSVYGMLRSFQIGVSGLVPWRDRFSKLPQRLLSRILRSSTSSSFVSSYTHSNSSSVNVKSESTMNEMKKVSTLWNCIIVKMVRDHLLSLHHCVKLLFVETITSEGTECIKEPLFFQHEEDVSSGSFFPRSSEAERRITYFAQSLTMNFPPSPPLESVPHFTVLIPHYTETIILSLRELIHTQDPSSRVTILDYLKTLFPYEWSNFVSDSKLFSEARGPISPVHHTVEGEHVVMNAVGFHGGSVHDVLRTRKWASLRSQTLFRSVTGFATYLEAVSVLEGLEESKPKKYREKNQEKDDKSGLEIRTKENVKVDTEKKTETGVDVRDKVTLLVAMQRYATMTDDELEMVEVLFDAVPSLHIAFLDTAPVSAASDADPSLHPVFQNRYFSCLITSSCSVLPSSEFRREPMLKIELPGPPILGDGKSDNQNHAVIYSRGEYIQLIDANQDNFFEEGLKIRNLLAEFTEDDQSFFVNPDDDVQKKEDGEEKGGRGSVAIVGAREHIFSERVGLLGDLAAAKEYTFGTITQRVAAKSSSRMHYGHPDVMNSVFMLTRGGVSKGQKGLHLNEDIYAGMNAIMRGGRIKHTEYFQCAKGRDLGFSTILGFVSKIGAGMAEQLLSREQYYIGTRMPLHRLLSFFYGHPGFHFNNVLSMLSITLFLLGLWFVAILSFSTTICDEISYDNPTTAQILGDDCFNALVIMQWLKRSVIAIGLVFFVSYLPLSLQIISDFGLYAAASRLVKHFLALAPLFEIFSTQMYTYSLTTIGLSHGVSAYINTGRGFAISRNSFSTLFSNFSKSSIFYGARYALLLIAISSAPFVPPHVAFFWVIALALCLSPFLFNPHQFDRDEFFLDYGKLWSFFLDMTPVSSDSWFSHSAKLRARLAEAPNFSVLVCNEVLVPITTSLLCLIAFLFFEMQNQQGNRKPASIFGFLVATVGLSLAPILICFVLSVLGLAISFVLGMTIGAASEKGSKSVGLLVYNVSKLLSVVVFFAIILCGWMLESWNLEAWFFLVVTMVFIQRCIVRFLTVLLIRRHYPACHEAWLSGRWYASNLSWRIIYLPFRELVCKTCEFCAFAADFWTCHVILFILFLFTLIPRIDEIHSIMLFWTNPSDKEGGVFRLGKPILTSSQQRIRRRRLLLNGVAFVCAFILFLGVLIVPPVVNMRPVLVMSTLAKMFS